MSNTREYKSDVFSMLMEYPENALQVYNMLNGTNHTDPSLVEIVTLDKGISLSIRNDAAFIIDYDLTISEHQSSYNPNMPLRSLIYFSTTMQKRIIKKKQDIFGRGLIKIPLPHFVVFYNGSENRPEKEILKLSDAYEKASENPELELICTVYNINYYHNSKMLNTCKVLNEYSLFVQKVREQVENLKKYDRMSVSIDEAVKKAIDYCIDHDILKEFLEERGNEVLHVMTFDCTFEAREKLWKEQEEMMSKQIDEQGKQIDDLSLQINEKGKQIDDLSSKNNEQARLIESLQEQIKTLQASAES